MKKRFLSGLLALCMALALLPLNAQATKVTGFPLPVDRTYNVTVLSRYSWGQEHASYLYDYGPLKGQAKDLTILLDIPAPKGTEIYAVADGTILTNANASASGNYVVIKHTDGSYSYYGHMLNPSALKKNSTVHAGDLIGYVGKTGEASGFHLHFEWSNHDPYCEYSALGYVHMASNSGASKYPHTHPPLCLHEYTSTGLCTKCKLQFPLNTTTLNTTLNVTAVNGSSKTAPAHTAPYGDAPIGSRLQVGSPVKVTGMAVNAFGNLWYRVSINGKEYWIVNSYLSVPVLVQNVEQSRITRNSVYLKGSMAIPSGVRVQSCGVAVDTAPNPIKGGKYHDSDSRLNYTNSTKYMWYTIKNLEPGTTYHYRFYIETADGRLSYGPDGCFTTSGSSCTHSYNSEGLCTKCGKAEYPLEISNLDTLMTVSKTNSVSLSAPAHTAPYGDAPIPARFYLEDAVAVTGQAKNRYGNLWYRVQVGDNTYWVVSDYLSSASVSKYITPSDPVTAPAPTPVPTKAPSKPASSASVSATGASQITASSVRLDGSCSYSGTRPSSVGVYLGTSSSSMTRRDSDTINHNKNPFNIWYTLSGLSSGTTYYYQFYAIAGGKEYVSSVKSFTTDSPAQPSATPRPTETPVPTPAPTPTPAPVVSSTGYVVGAGRLAINDKAAASPKYSTEIGSIPDGAPVTVYTDKTSGNWYYVSYNGVTGYAYKSYITFNTRTGVVTGTDSLAINNKAAVSPKYSTEIGAIPGGASMRVYPDKTSGNWYYVTYNGITGYAYKSYITLQ